MFENLVRKAEEKERIKEIKLLYFAKSESEAENCLPHRYMHSHSDRVELLFVEKGSGSYRIDNCTYEVSKGDILVLHPGVLHEERENPDEQMTVYCCGLTGVYLPGLKKNHVILEGVPPVLHAGIYEAHIHNILECIRIQLTEKHPGSDEIYTSLLVALLAIVRQISSFEEAHVSAQFLYESTSRVKNYLDANCHEEISLDTVAANMNMSVSYLAHSLKKSTGFSPGQYIIQRRIGEAQTLLITTDYSITQISTMVGYDNSNYFSTLFTKLVGMSPREYRNYWKKI